MQIAREGHGHDAHRLLGVVGAVRIGHICRREQLCAPEDPRHRRRKCVCEQIQQQQHHQERGGEPEHRREHQALEGLLQTADLHGAPACAADARADQAEDQRMTRAGRQAQVPGHQIPNDRRHECGDDQRLCGQLGRDDALANRRRDRGA